MYTDIYDYSDYRDYLKAMLSLKNKAAGSRAELSEELNCQASFISQVCTKKAHLSLEHSVMVSSFLNLTKVETEFFMLLVQQNKAGSTALSSYFLERVNEHKQNREVIREKIKVKSEVSAQDQATYYSYWWYSAVHIATSIPNIKTPFDISQYLKIPLDKTKEILNFLLDCGLVIKVSNEFFIGESRIHVGTNSPLLASHHRNWRTQMLKKIDNLKNEDVHFSGVLGVSKKDAQKIRKMILDVFKNAEPLLQTSEEEAVYIFTTDFYEL